MPSDLRVRETGLTRQVGEFVLAEGAAYAQGRVVPVHLGRGQQAAEEKHAPVREQMPVQVVYQNAHPGDAVHLPEDADSLGPGEVMEEEGGRHDVERAGVNVEPQRIADLYADPAPHPVRKRVVEVVPRVVDRSGVQIDADNVDAAPAPVAVVHQIDEAVPPARPDVQNPETPMRFKDRPQDRPRGAVAAEKPVREPKIPKRLVQPDVSDGQVVHDLVDMDAAGEVGGGEDIFGNDMWDPFTKG